MAGDEGNDHVLDLLFLLAGRPDEAMVHAGKDEDLILHPQGVEALMQRRGLDHRHERVLIALDDQGRRDARMDVQVRGVELHVPLGPEGVLLRVESEDGVPQVDPG